MTNESASSHGQSQRKSTLNHNDNDSLEKPRKFRWSSCFSFISKIKKNNRQTRIRASQSYEALDQDDKDDNKKTELIEDTSITWKEQQERDRLNLELKQQKLLQLQQQQLDHQYPLQQIQQQIITPSSALSPPPRQFKTKRETISSVAELNAGRRPLVDPTLTPKIKPRSNKKKQSSLLRLSLDADMMQTSSSSSQDTTISSISNQSDSDSISCKTARSSSDQSFIPFRSGTLGGMIRSRLSLTSAPPLPPPQIVIPPLPDSRSSSDILASHITADSPLSYSSNSNNNSRPNSDGLTIKERRKRTSPASIPSADHLTIALKEWVDQQSEDHPKYRHRQSQIEDKNSNDNNNNSNSNNNNTTNNNHNHQEYIQEKYRQEAMLSLEGKKIKAVSAQPIANTRELDYHFERKTDENDKPSQLSEKRSSTSMQDLVRDKAHYDAIVSRTMGLRRQPSQDERQPNNTASRTISRIKSATYLENSSEKKQEKPLGIICENETLLLNDKSGPASAMYDTKMLLPIPSHLVPPETPPHHIQSAPSLVSSPSTPNSFESSMYEQDDYVSHQLAFVHSSIQ
ncbi:hypothetical protein K501DRAFT_329353 [Backusella circina FSU 941]|nr:hypothetical protein K501DRAFT_329353 [Backusella circina FSU 941]